LVLKLAGLLIPAFLIIAVLIIMLVPLIGVTYYDEEPCIVTEDYLRKETYTEDVPVDYEVTATEVDNSWWRPSADCSVTIKNGGNASGYFRIEFNLVTLDGEEVTKAVWQNLEIGEQKEVIVRHYGDHVKTPFTYEVTPPTMGVLKTRLVPDTRERLVYQSVEKTRKVSLFEYLKDWR